MSRGLIRGNKTLWITESMTQRVHSMGCDKKAFHAGNCV